MPDDFDLDEVAEEVAGGTWRRRLVLPDQDGHLRLTPVKTVRTGPPPDSENLRLLDHEKDNGRRSA